MSVTVTSLIITCAICYGTFRYLMWHWGRRRLYKKASKFGGPSPIPFIGSAHLLVGSAEYLGNQIMKLGAMYPSPFRLWLGPRLFIVVTDPEHIKGICLSPKALGKGDVAEFSGPLFGEGLFTAPVSKWQAQRKLIQPTFNPKILDSFIEVFVAQSQIFTDLIEPNLNGPEFEIFHLVGTCTLDMICESAMGVKIGAQTEGNFSFVEAVQATMESFCERFFHFWLHPDIIFYKTKLGRDQRRHIKLLHDFTDDVIQMRKNELLQRRSQPEKPDNEDDVCNPVLRRPAFLDHLMELTDRGSKLSDRSLREEVNTMVVTGNDTSAITLTNVMLMVASHPEIQEKVYQELYEIYGDDDCKEHPVTSKDLPRMKYLERVLKETMRLFPIAPLLVRAVADDVDIGNHVIPRGSTAIMGILRLHRNEKYWPDPLKFDPDRFLPEEVAKRHPYTYMAFGAGPRNCIGYNYALMSMKTLIATVLRRYILKKDNIVPVKDIRLKVEILLKIAEPVTLRIEKRITALTCNGK